jgi:hypothetical protein
VSRFVRLTLSVALSAAAYSCAPQTGVPAATNSTICNGTWQVVQSPNSDAEDQALVGAAATSLSDVWAVGWAETDGERQSLIEHWDGLSWTIAPSPRLEGQSTVLLAAGALDAGDAWSVGYAEDPDGARTPFIVHWDGQAWEVVPSPQIGVGSNELRGVTAQSRDSVWAVGYYSDESGVPHALIQHWNGESWSVAKSPSQVNGEELLGISSQVPDQLWAVGPSGPLNGSTLRPTTQHWDGITWTTVDTEHQAGEGFMAAVVAISPTDTWIVGAFGTLESNAIRAPAAEHWDGHQWARVEIPRPSAGDARLSGIAAGAADQVWAVGYQSSPETQSKQTLAILWDGKMWSIASTPNLNNESNVLTAVTQAQGHYWAVGNYEVDGSLHTLIEHSCVEPGQA